MKKIVDIFFFFFFSSRRRHTRLQGDWSSDVCSSDLYFAEHVRGMLGIDFVRANVLEMRDGALTGGLIEQPWGDICDGAEKRRTLLEVASLLGIRPDQCIAVEIGRAQSELQSPCNLVC